MPPSELPDHPPIPHDRTVGELVAAARRGEQEAWRTIVERHQESLIKAARVRGLDEAAAADAAQQTWLNAFLKIGSLRAPEALGSWLHAILRHEVIRVGTRLARERLEADVEAGAGRVLHAAEPVLPDAAVVRLEEARLINRAQRTLSRRDQDLIELTVERSDVGYREVAQRLGMQVGSIGPTRIRCFARMRRELATLGMAAAG